MAMNNRDAEAANRAHWDEVAPVHLESYSVEGLLRGESRIDEQIFVEEKDPEAKVLQVACHELVHACAAPLRPPSWLGEGIAMATVDRFAGKTTVMPESLKLIRDYPFKAAPAAGREVPRLRREDIVYHFARGYWLVRYLEETRAGLIRRLLARGERTWPAEAEMAAELGIKKEDFWKTIDGLIVAHCEGGGKG